MNNINQLKKADYDQCMYYFKNKCDEYGFTKTAQIIELSIGASLSRQSLSRIYHAGSCDLWTIKSICLALIIS